jgi:hypothetical protein
MHSRTKGLPAIATSVVGRYQLGYRHRLGYSEEPGIAENDTKVVALAEMVGSAGGQRTSGPVKIIKKDMKKEEGNGH